MTYEDMMLRPSYHPGNIRPPFYSRVYLDKCRVSPYNKFRVENMLD